MEIDTALKSLLRLNDSISYFIKSLIFIELSLRSNLMSICLMYWFLTLDTTGYSGPRRLFLNTGRSRLAKKSAAVLSLL